MRVRLTILGTLILVAGGVAQPANPPTSDRSTTVAPAAAVTTNGGSRLTLTLDEAIRLAVENNLVLRDALLSAESDRHAVVGALAKFGMGMKHGDGNTRQCMATAVVAYKQSFGFDAPPYSYKDFEESDVMVFVGANPCVAHPIMWERVAMNKRDPKIIVVDPRRTETAIAGTHHLPLLPKSDLALFYGLASYLIEHDLLDRDFIEASTTGFAEFAEFLKEWPITRAAKESGLPRELLEEVAELIGSGKRVSFWWTMGVNQGHESTRVAQSLINLALMTGNIGKPGTGANSITGQCNAMGSRLFSNTTNLLGGHKFESPEHRAKVAEITGVPESAIQTECGMAYDQIVE